MIDSWVSPGDEAGNLLHSCILSITRYLSIDFICYIFLSSNVARAGALALFSD